MMDEEQQNVKKSRKIRLANTIIGSASPILMSASAKKLSANKK